MSAPYGWIGFDLDGTLAHYGGWLGETEIGAPIADMVELAQKYLSEGWQVKVFTARAHEASGEAIAAIEAWCLEHIGKKLEVTCIKDMKMVTLYDDRAVGVEFNTGRVRG